MFGIQALNIVISMIFIYLLFSLFVSIINEMISRLFNTRGNQLFETVHELIGDEGVKALYQDPRINILVQKGSKISGVKKKIDDLKNKRLPDFIPEEIFGEIIADIPNEKLKGYMETVDEELKNTKEEVTKIFETALLKTQQVYKQNMRFWVFIISAIVTVSFNVDSIKIFKILSNDPALAAAVASQAEQYIALNDSLDLGYSDAGIDSLKRQLRVLHQEQVAGMEQSMGIGWNTPKIWKELRWHSLPGFIITVLALSLGAPFWFDLLKKVVNIKNELKPTNTKS